MQSGDSIIFTPAKIGPVTLRNRTIRSAAFENMCTGHSPSKMLADYHLSVARGGVGMTTIAYASVDRSGLSFDNQLWMRPEIVPQLRTLTDQIHATGAKVSIQLGHCGNMSHKSTAGRTPVSASSGFNMYSPTLVHGMSQSEIDQVARDFGDATRMAIDAGFDCVEIHAGHGYLISQFLSPYTNHRRDRYGGKLNDRMTFMRQCMEHVQKAANGQIAVVAKTNMRDGFKGGNSIEEGIIIAQELEKLGCHALVLSGGFVSRAPMYVMRGAMPIQTLTGYMDCWWLKWSVRMFGKMLIKTEPYSDLYFLDDAKIIRQNVALPLIYVGGCASKQGIEHVLNSGFLCVQMARALIVMPDFVNQMRLGAQNCGCEHVNYCIGRMYSLEMACHKHRGDLTPRMTRELEKFKRDNAKTSQT